MFYELKASPDTIHWGYFDASLEPVLVVSSGDYVSIEAVTHQAGDAPDLLMDEGIREIYDTVPTSDRNPGVHIMTGPIGVKGAKQGDVIEVRYLSMVPRFAFGTNLSANWGYLFAELGKRERVTLFALDETYGIARAMYSYENSGPQDYPGRIIANEWIEKVPALAGFRIGISPHLGTAGVAPNEVGRVSTIPPGKHGGNIDNWRIGAGSRMYYPVLVDGALFSVGDPHLSQGDGELNGTAMEASLNVTMQIILHKNLEIPNPILETNNEWYLHGFGDSLDEAMKDASLSMLDFLVSQHNLTREDAYVLMSIACNFGVTQVVDRRLGIHASVAKSVFPTAGFQSQ